MIVAPRFGVRNFPEHMNKPSFAQKCSRWRGEWFANSHLARFNQQGRAPCITELLLRILQ